MPTNWDDEDMMEGYDTDPTPSPEVQSMVRNRKPQLAAASRVVEELEESPVDSSSGLSEAEWRLEKAGFYRAVINSQLLSSDHPAAVEVEEELQDWAKRQLETLLGIRPQDPVSGAVSTTASVQFSEDEAQALRLLAAKVLTKATPTNVPQVKPVPPEPIPQPVKPVVSKPPPAIKPVGAKASPQAGSRGRGRPRKHPCKVCGQMECSHKVKDTKPSAQQLADSGEMYDGLPIQISPDGTKFVDAPNGRRYKLEIRTMTHKETGQQRQAYVPLEWSMPETGAKPYPSPEEAMALAAVEAQRNAGAVQSNPIFKKMVDAAMSAPEKEPYVPEPT